MVHTSESSLSISPDMAHIQVRNGSDFPISIPMLVCYRNTCHNSRPPLEKGNELELISFFFKIWPCSLRGLVLSASSVHRYFRSRTLYLDKPLHAQSSAKPIPRFKSSRRRAVSFLTQDPSRALILRSFATIRKPSWRLLGDFPLGSKGI